jgi:hypothetical protein
MLPAEAFEMRKPLLALSLAKPRYNVEAALKNELFIYGDVHYISNSFCKNVLKIATAYVVIAFFKICSYCYYSINF